MNQYPKSPSWVPVILLLILFWPVGLYLLYRKLAADTRIRGTKGKGLTVAGCIIIIIGACSLFQLPQADTSVVTGAFTFFVVIGIIFILQAGKIKREAPLNPGYAGPEQQDLHYQPVQNLNNISKPVITKVVACPNCGANNTIEEGQPAECEYCGSSIP